MRCILILFLLFFVFGASTQNCRQKSEFRCLVDGKCVSMKKWQDGIDDCYDASDEACMPWQFDCQFGSPRCISQKQLNDGKIDCYSGFDEGCPSHFYVCKDRSQCIEPAKYLDGIADCKDRSDEPCAQDQFQCADGSKCIPRKLFQNGHDDCDDGSDEECTASQFSCPCGAVRCVGRNAISDGIWDCADGSDELFANASSLSSSSSSSSKKTGVCANGEKMRNGAANSLSIGTVQLCAMENPCRAELGQICIVIGGSWRCVCKLGTIRPIGSTKCIPVELLSRYMKNAVNNCSADYATFKFGTLRELQLARRHKPGVEIRRSPTARTAISLSGTTPDGFLDGEGAEKVPFMFQEEEEKEEISDETIDTYGTGQPPVSFKFQRDEHQCDPTSNSSCRGSLQECQLQADSKFRCSCRMNTVFMDGECRELRNECTEGTHTCAKEGAICVDSVIGYECLCREGYLDTSPQPQSKPGRNCLKLINECAHAAKNDCSPNAKCFDKPVGYSCRCQDGYVDVSEEARRAGRKCVKAVNECVTNEHNCDKNAVCTDLALGFSCRCPFGFNDISLDANLPGRKCVDASIECVGCNSTFSQCIETASKNRVCACLPGYVDMSPITPGQNCQRVHKRANPCQDYSLHDCDPLAECFSEQPGYFQCKCPNGFSDVSPDAKRFPGRKCVRAVDECALGRHTCDPRADCLDTADGYTCKCRNGWRDASTDPLRSPGRTCKKADMCSNIDCAVEAECRETPIGPMCQCVSGYVDVSRQHGKPAGRVCRAVVNECAERRDDCSPNASCIDTADGFTCRCLDGYRDESPDTFKNPGKTCVKSFVPDPPECDVSDPMSCDQRKREVCLFVNNTYKCRCAGGYSRLPDGRCVVINECQHARLNTCGKNAECIDLAEGYTCQCRSGYADISPTSQPGRICRARINECSNKEKYNVDCSENAICVDTDDSYTCQCRPGFADVSAAFNRLPGRRCIEAVNECSSRNLNDCSQNAICEDAKEGYLCNCRPGYVDTSPNSTHYPGRICTKPIEKVLASSQQRESSSSSSFSTDSCDPKQSHCATNEMCIDRIARGHYTCECADNAFRFTDGSCRLYSACSKKNECDRNAVCLNRFDEYTCQCRPGFIDVSDDLNGRPGRKCKELINECATADNECSPNARCIDATDGYACQCLEGFIDVSSRHGQRPGRRCTSAANECSDKSLNTCDENADCIDSPDGYLCQCYAGFIDVSSNANLPPGRVCTVQTTCPKQKTDLVFLIDGSGSIGSYVFKNEVLRFVREFVELFEIGRDKTRVGLIQYSDQIRHEFDLDQYGDKASLLRGISETQYLTGLTRTGAAIQHMVQEGFSERRGARPRQTDIARVAIILTDGRSQDNVTAPAVAARKLSINTFAIGVTDHVLASELESIAGSPSRWFYVDKFKDLDTRLRSMIQKAACPSPSRQETSPEGECNPRTQTGCDRTLNERCISDNGRPRCTCPAGFTRHPLTRVCGGDLCNPQLITSCVFPEECQITPYSNYRCACPDGYNRDYRSGFCVSVKEIRIEPQHDGDCHNGGLSCSTNEHCVNGGAHWYCQCLPGFERTRSGQCTYPGSCNPADPNSCNIRKREQCLPNGNLYTCQCARNEKRHPITEICLKNECMTGEHDCDRSARCIDTDEGYLCVCPTGFIDHSPNPIARPGRLCVAQQNECLDGSNKCSPNALCTDTESGYICRCKPGYVDYSPNPQSFSGEICKELVNECLSPRLNTCSRDAHCIDTVEGYSCICKPGFTDMDEFRNPGRVCQKVQQNDKCSIGKNDCDRNARCIQIGDNDYSCSCPPGFKDKSPSASILPGRLCIPVIPECDNPTLNDCDSPDRAICTDTDDGYMCRCRQGFLDISPNIRIKPGRLCKPLQNECTLGIDDCARDGGICEDTPDAYNCRCAMNYLDVSYDRVNRPGRKCKRLINECITGQNDCSREALCTDTEDSYICACPESHIDLSPDTVNRPGRRCLRRINECTSNRHDCSPNSDCIDTPDSFTCKCRDDFVDDSPDVAHRPGRVCRPALVDECRTGKHDCHRDALCQDLAHGYTCQCRDGYLDVSPHRSTLPGRQCQPRPTPPPPECQLDGINQCKMALNEVCRLVGGEPKCSCPVNYQRDASGACSVINECLFAQLNDCHTSAECVDQLNGYTCRCRNGYRDIGSRPGRMCKQMVNECEFPHLNDCSQNARCVDLEEGYECRCNQGFMDQSNNGRPGRICKQLVNECARPSLNTCDRNAQCHDETEGYRCECNPGFIDVSPSLKGRACRQLVNECANPKLNDCDKNAQCRDTTDSYECQCPPNSKDISPSASFPGRVCLQFIDECSTGQHDCDPSATCRDNEQSFTCECPAGYIDRSPNKLSRSGRVCVRLVDECREGRHTCSAQADCRDLEEGYTCECKDGYVDRSPNLAGQPGRVCSAPEVCPSNHDCSSAAVCEPLGGMKYQCTCIQGYVDHSPNGQKGRVCVRNNACRDPRYNTCSRNAICYDEPTGYRCECKRGYLDRSPDPSSRGRVCEQPPPPTPPPIHPCQHPERNDCHPAGTCRATGPQEYTCECLAGYVDKSPDVRTRPGRLCVQTEPICLDASQNDCHPAAICSEVNGPEKYTCKCRDGYIDQSPDSLRRPGRVCRRMINECLDRSLNDCHASAMCQDLPDGYTCRCPVTMKDQSPNPQTKPGRICTAQVNECANPSLNSCSAFADCFDRENGYECRCRQGYHDDEPSNPGRRCSFMINECESSNLNDCDKNAICTDTAGGYECACRAPYKDEGPTAHPGRICRLNECLNPNLNNCDKNADCRDLDYGYTCVCRHGFYDQSPNQQEAGRVCIEFQQEQPIQRVDIKPPQRVEEDGLLCGRDRCVVARGEVCIGGEYCGCKPGEGRSASNGRCQPVDETPLQVRVVSRDRRPLMYSSEYGSNKNPSYVEIVELFQRNMATTFGGTSLAPRYVNTKVDYITHPKTVNSSWDQGLLFKYEIQTTKNKNTLPIDECELWKQMQSSLDRTNGAIGGGSLRVATDNELLNPCKQQEEWGECGGRRCREKLGEICLAGQICGCPDGMKRANIDAECRVVESWNVPLWVVRDKERPILYSESLDNPQTQIYKSYANRIEKGIEGCYPHTELRNAFVTSEVNDIVNPVLLNSSYDSGLLFNTTVHFRKGMVRIPSDAYYQLVKYITKENNNEVGESDLYLNPVQPDPFKPCFKNDCDAHGKCIETSKYNYKCECAAGYRDMNPLLPGRTCLPVNGFNECERKEDNQCSENARCVDLEHLYKCECLPSFYDASPSDAIPGSMCVLDYCSDVNFCPTNTTCKNMEQQAECRCDAGFMDIRKSEKRTMLGMTDDTLCMHVRDVDECALGLNNCSGVAHCIDRAVGYTCRCPDGYIDGNPDEPGRVCGALLCDLCNAHGDCVHNSATNNITCVCTDGWSGAQCQVAPSNASLVLLILLALLFLLLTLCCLLYFCTKCHCFKGRAAAGAAGLRYGRGAWPWSTLEGGSSSSESGADFSNEYYPDIGIPRAKLKGVGTMERSHDVARMEQYLEESSDDRGAMRIPRAHLAGAGTEADSFSEASSDYTIREEVERRVTTDVTTKEIKTTTTTDATGNTIITTSERLVEPDEHAYGTTTMTTNNHTSYADDSSYYGKEGVSTSSIVNHNGYAAGYSNQLFDEKERGESIAEFSIGKARGAAAATSSAHHLQHHHHQQHQNLESSSNREIEEYQESDAASSTTEEHEIGDIRHLVSRNYTVDPIENGQIERSRNEYVTTKTSSSTVTRP